MSNLSISTWEIISKSSRPLPGGSKLISKVTSSPFLFLLVAFIYIYIYAFIVLLNIAESPFLSAIEITLKPLLHHSQETFQARSLGALSAVCAHFAKFGPRWSGFPGDGARGVKWNDRTLATPDVLLCFLKRVLYHKSTSQIFSIYQ